MKPGRMLADRWSVLVFKRMCGTHVGGSLDQLPQTQLPQVRTALRLYRSLRTNNPDASKMELARLIANDVILLWQKARVPTAALDKCITRVQAAIDFWSNTSRNPNQRETTLFREKLDALLDLTPKPNGRGGDKKREEEFLKNLMRSEGKQKNKNAWKDEMRRRWWRIRLGDGFSVLHRPTGKICYFQGANFMGANFMGVNWAGFFQRIYDFYHATFSRKLAAPFLEDFSRTPALYIL